MPEPRDAACGFVFAATRPRHQTFARRAARSLREVLPDAAIDLYTDGHVDDPVFDRVHILERNWHRPKIEALRRSRFDRTIYLDNDIVTVADGSDIFALLGKVEVAGVHDNNRNSGNARRVAGNPVPAAFPSINSGVLGVRRNRRTQDALAEWERRIAEHGHRVDQPALRSVLWESGLRLGILPVEYNLMNHALIGAAGANGTAPRFIHMREATLFSRDPGDPLRPYDLREFYSTRTLACLRGLLAADRTLGAGDGLPRGLRGRLGRFCFDARMLGVRLLPLRLSYLATTLWRRLSGEWPRRR